MRALNLVLLCLALGPVSGCQTHVSQADVLNSDAEVSLLQATRAWEVVEGGRVVGNVVEFEERVGEYRFFSVRNTLQQELGLVDIHGRAWRYRAHVEEPEWLCTGTILDGASAILELSSTPELFEVALELLENSSTEL